MVITIFCPACPSLAFVIPTLMHPVIPTGAGGEAERGVEGPAAVLGNECHSAGS